MTETIKVTAKIGHGEKRHRAIASREETAPGTPWSRVRYSNFQFACSCPNTQNGHARHAASIVAEGWELANCGN